MCMEILKTNNYNTDKVVQTNPDCFQSFLLFSIRRLVVASSAVHLVQTSSFDRMAAVAQIRSLRFEQAPRVEWFRPQSEYSNLCSSSVHSDSHSGQGHNEH